MTIAGYSDKSEFVSKLNQHVSASQPLRSIEGLFGREKEISLIEEALYAEGRHAFIYGDRGVGKSSLAAAAASQYQSSDNRPIQVSCGPDTTFYQTIEEIAQHVVKKANGKRKYNAESSLNLKIYTVKWKNEDREITIPSVDSIYSAVEAIEETANCHSKCPVVVIDEFDQISSHDERKLFAVFLKALGDSCVGIKFIFTGVASSLQQLLGDHQSSFRQLLTIPLDRLNWTPRETIVKDALKSFGISVDPEVLYSIAKLSNGFPYYAHLITERLLWDAFNNESVVDLIGQDEFEEALRGAIAGIQAHLDEPYQKATLRRTNDYREIVWATADSESMLRYSHHLFSSYLRIHEQLYGKDPSPEDCPLPKDKFMKRLANLKKPEYGGILESVTDRKGIYSYRENFLRGYVAMKALEAGVELQGDKPDEPKVPTAMAREKRQTSAGKDLTPNVKFRGEE